MDERRVGVLGARGQTGSRLVPLAAQRGWSVAAFTREPAGLRVETGTVPVSWYSLDQNDPPQLDGVISTIPIWELPNHLDRIAASGARRLVVLSSTSVFTKAESPDREERDLARRLAAAEAALATGAGERGIGLTILRPTMIYGYGRDHNISSLLRFIERFGFVPVLGEGRGLRQPIHVDDVAAACIAALEASDAANRDFNLSGGETLSYREMCERLFIGLSRRPRIVTVPRWAFAAVKPLNRLLPRRLRWLIPMFERMNHDLAFDDSEARRCLGVNPRPFHLEAEDLRAEPSRILP